MEHCLFVLLIAVIIDRVFGDPEWLWRRIPHPIVFIGHSISYFDRHLNSKEMSDHSRKLNGCLAIISLLLVTFVIGVLLIKFLYQLSWLETILEAIIVSIFLAQKSLIDHVVKVGEALRFKSLNEAQLAVSMIVGRDTKKLDRSGICRAAIESLAENSSDGVVAPAFWFLVLGLPGILCYKVLNTADSMIGYRNNRYKDFGWASARLDDLANLIPARLTALITICALLIFQNVSRAKNAFSIVIHDAKHHRSPNAGWPECAYAGGLNIQLAGPRVYEGEIVDEPFQNAKGRVANTSDIFKSVKLFKQSMTLFGILIFCCWMI